MHCDYPDSRPTRNNVIRWCVSEDDGRKTGKSAAGFSFVTWGEGIADCAIHQCATFLRGKGSGEAYGLAAYVVSGYGGDDPHLARCSFRNNVAMVDGANLALILHQVSGTDKVVFQGNRYHAADGVSWTWRDGGTTYSTLDAWRDGKGQERIGAADVGSAGDPLLRAPGGAGLLTDPHALAAGLAGYRLRNGSACADGGLDLAALFGIDAGGRDLFGDPAPSRGWCVGVHDPIPRTIAMDLRPDWLWDASTVEGDAVVDPPSGSVQTIQAQQQQDVTVVAVPASGG